VKMRKTKRTHRRRRWDDNITIDLKRNVVSGCGLDLSDSGQVPLAGSCVKGNKYSGKLNGFLG
jgi:hypothetical protein